MCSLVGNVVWPAASGSCAPDLRTVVDSTLALWAEINQLLYELLLSEYFITGTETITTAEIVSKVE